MEFTPHGVCSKNIHLEVDEAGRIHQMRIQSNILPGSAFTCFKRIFKQ